MQRRVDLVALFGYWWLWEVIILTMPPLVSSPNQQQATPWCATTNKGAFSTASRRRGTNWWQKTHYYCSEEAKHWLPSQPLEPIWDNNQTVSLSHLLLLLLWRIGRSVNTGRGPETPWWVMVSTPRGLLLTSLLVLPLRTLLPLFDHPLSVMIHVLCRKRYGRCPLIMLKHQQHSPLLSFKQNLNW